MKYKENLKGTKINKLQQSGDMEEFKKYILHKGIIIFDYEWEIKESRENFKFKTILLTEKEGLHREQTVLVDGVLATIHMRNGEVVSTGLKLVSKENDIFIQQVLESSDKYPIAKNYPCFLN